MHTVIIGGGIAGLGAAWELRKRGHDVTIVEAEDEAGGRCRSHLWHGQWLVKGATAFIRSETNLVELAKELGIWDESAIVDMTELHRHHILHKREKVFTLRDFTPTDILKLDVIPAGERLKLARVLPKLAAQLVRNDPRDLTSAVALDGETACGYFRQRSPTFVDYVLEPIMQMFCGYGEDDYSLGWLLWVMSGLAWAESWWTFPEGVGLLTRTLAARLEEKGVAIHLATRARELRHDDRSVALDVDGPRGSTTIRADAAVMAVQGALVAPLIPGLDDARRRFFSRVGYVAHHIATFLVEAPALAEPVTVQLPTADGWERITAVFAFPMGDGTALCMTESKGFFEPKLEGLGDERALDELWHDFPVVIPELRGARTIDRHLHRNPLAIAKREVGYIAALKEFLELPPLPRVAFAGDYLLNSTVGQAHWTGLRAAAALAK